MFEDIQCASRATVVIRRYEELYSQARIEALDAIEALHFHGPQDSTADMDASDMFNVRFLLQVFKVWCTTVSITAYYGQFCQLGF